MPPPKSQWRIPSLHFLRCAGFFSFFHRVAPRLCVRVMMCVLPSGTAGETRVGAGAVGDDDDEADDLDRLKKSEIIPAGTTVHLGVSADLSFPRYLHFFFFPE